MPRKGDRKVRTGCLTCKIRKVKCDEVKPWCFRCTGTGRKCDGYAEPKMSKATGSDYNITLLRPTNHHSGRSIEYYHNVAGPGLSGQFGDKFWTKLLLQLSQRESAVKHAIMAISVMYEHRPENQTAAINHYNTAIRETLASADEELAIVMAILFTCVEFMHGNAAAATSHCRHAILIANKFLPGPLQEPLQSILVRLSVFPFFFGCDHETFPKLRRLDGPLAISPIPGVDEAQPALEVLVAQTIRFMRSTDKYRLSVQRHSRVPLKLYDEQHQISLALDNWHVLFQSFQSTGIAARMGVRHLALLQIIYLVAKIWISTTLEREECAYDKHSKEFADIVACAQRVEASHAMFPYQYIQPKFSFDMGFLPLLYFVVLKCRVLKLRLAALDCMKVLGVDQEALWTASTLTRVAHTLIQIEHGLDLDKDKDSWPDVMPMEENRVRECMLDQETDKITFILWRPPDELYSRTVAVEPRPNQQHP